LRSSPSRTLARKGPQIGRSTLLSWAVGPIGEGMKGLGERIMASRLGDRPAGFAAGYIMERAGRTLGEGIKAPAAFKIASMHESEHGLGFIPDMAKEHAYIPEPSVSFLKAGAAEVNEPTIGPGLQAEPPLGVGDSIDLYGSRQDLSPAAFGVSNMPAHEAHEFAKDLANFMDEYQPTPDRVMVFEEAFHGGHEWLIGAERDGEIAWEHWIEGSEPHKLDAGMARADEFHEVVERELPDLYEGLQEVSAAPFAGAEKPSETPAAHPDSGSTGETSQSGLGEFASGYQSMYGIDWDRVEGVMRGEEA